MAFERKFHESNLILLIIILLIILLPKLDLFSVEPITIGKIKTIDMPDSASAGESIRLFVSVENIGSVTGRISSKIIDNETEVIIAKGIADDVNPGESKWANTITTPMPSKDWKLRIEVGHYEENIGQCGDWNLCHYIDEIQYHTIKLITACNTEADTNCDGIVSRTELGTFITKWIEGQATRTELGHAIEAWK